MNQNTLNPNANDQLILVNVVEEMVRQEVDKRIRDKDMCKCQKCRLDACAIALNSLESFYVTTRMGALLREMMNTQISYRTTVMVEVIKALEVVEKRPQHDNMQSSGAGRK